MSDEFSLRMNGQFWGILHWSQLDDLWSRVRAAPEGWYASLTGEAAPESPLAAEALHHFVAEVDALLRREHDYDYCGIVYADDPIQPGLIKIFDPHNLGSSCGCSGAKIPPRWVLSRIKPDRIEDNAPLPHARKRWWRGLFG
jgi:hypothetical protein